MGSQMAELHRILVTGAGGPAGIAVIQELNRIGITTIGCDIDPYGAGLRLATAHDVLPAYSAPDYLDCLLAIASKHSADGLIVTMTEEMSVLADEGKVLTDHGLAHWLAAKSCIDACMDKALFAQVMQAGRQPVPATATGDVEAALAIVPGPWIVKPRFGRGSREIFSADTTAQVRAAWPCVTEPVLQTRLSGREFTFDVLVERNGRLAGGVPRFRLKTESGISTTGRTFAAPGLFELTEAFLACVGHEGSANVQGFITEDGQCGFSEINPRFSGGLPLSLRAGADLVGQYVRGMWELPIQRERLDYRPGTLMIRHWAESVYLQDVPPPSAIRPIDAPAAFQSEAEGP